MCWHIRLNVEHRRERGHQRPGCPERSGGAERSIQLPRAPVALARTCSLWEAVSALRLDPRRDLAPCLTAVWTAATTCPQHSRLRRSSGRDLGGNAGGALIPGPQCCARIRFLAAPVRAGVSGRAGPWFHSFVSLEKLRPCLCFSALVVVPRGCWSFWRGLRCSWCLCRRDIRCSRRRCRICRSVGS